MKKQKGFSLAELMIAIALTGLLLIIVCGVFVFGINAIEKSKIRSTALNLADKKIAESRNIIMSLDSSYLISGDKLISIISDAALINVGPDLAEPGSIHSLEWGSLPNEVYATGTIQIKGTADYTYEYFLVDDQENLKKIRVEITWNEERVGPQKIALESLVSMLR